MHLVEILGSEDFKRTVEIVFFTGEEEGLYGSAAYVFNAAEPYAMVVFDVIGYDSTTDSLFTVGTGSPGTHTANANDAAIGGMFQDALSEYSISGTAVINSSFSSDYTTDIFSLWGDGSTKGAVQVNEDLNSMTPYYHGANDTVANMDLPQVVNITKAAVVVVANIAEYESGGAPPASGTAKTSTGALNISTGGMVLQ